MPDSPRTEPVSGTRHLSDAAFADAIERCALANDAFRHYDHVRLAWIVLRDAGPGGFDLATSRMVTTLRRAAAAAGKVHRYHDTITRAYMRVVDTHMAATPDAESFAEFAPHHDGLFAPDLLYGFYSRARLDSDEARAAFVAPDLHPLPLPR